MPYRHRSLGRCGRPVKPNGSATDRHSSAKRPCATSAPLSSRTLTTARDTDVASERQTEAATDSVTVDRRNNRFVHLEHAGVGIRPRTGAWSFFPLSRTRNSLSNRPRKNRCIKRTQPVLFAVHVRNINRGGTSCLLSMFNFFPTEIRSFSLLQSSA